MDSDKKLIICKKIRQFSAQALAISLKKLLKQNKPISETDLRDAWLYELRKNINIISDGWYIPPPHGISILFSTEKNSQRTSPSSLRLKEFWPRNDIFLNRQEGIILVYASPVDKKTGIIGDFGLTLYFGHNKKIKNHLKKCFRINQTIFNYAKAGMTFSQLNSYTHKLLKSEGLTSNLLSQSDPTLTNIGHTIPFSYEDWTEEETDIKEMISKKRVFLNLKENFIIKKGMAFTIEPRPYVRNDPQIPAVFFHTIALFYQSGKKELLTDFKDLLKITGD